MTDAPKPAPQRQIVKFFLKHGTVIDWPVTDPTFTMPGLVAGIRSNGFFMAADLYVPADEIACIGLGAAAKIIQPAAGRMQ